MLDGLNEVSIGFQYNYNKNETNYWQDSIDVQVLFTNTRSRDSRE